MYPFTIMIYNRNYSDYSNIFRSNNGKEIEREFKHGQEKNSTCDWSVCIKQFLRLDWKAWQSASYRPFNFLNFFFVQLSFGKQRRNMLKIGVSLNLTKPPENLRNHHSDGKLLRPRGKRELRLTNCFHKDQNLNKFCSFYPLAYSI